MTYHGMVKGGVVVLEGGAQLPDGTRVAVQPIPSSQTGGEVDPLLNLGDLAIETGISDLAANIDHYLYGHPKASNGQ